MQTCLAVIQVGDDPASSIYVRNKKGACADVGIESLSYELPEETTEEELVKLVKELNENDGTVTITHSRTKDLKEVTGRADILVVAIGKPKFITADYVKEGAVVIDVGMHRNEENKLCGDVDFDDIKDKVSAITPVPGGVGPMTIAMLMYNCVEAAKGQEVE